MNPPVLNPHNSKIRSFHDPPFRVNCVCCLWGKRGTKSCILLFSFFRLASDVSRSRLSVIKAVWLTIDPWFRRRCSEVWAIFWYNANECDKITNEREPNRNIHSIAYFWHGTSGLSGLKLLKSIQYLNWRVHLHTETERKQKRNGRMSQYCWSLRLFT